jgi:hypothetical protein
MDAIRQAAARTRQQEVDPIDAAERRAAILREEDGM